MRPEEAYKARVEPRSVRYARHEVSSSLDTFDSVSGAPLGGFGIHLMVVFSAMACCYWELDRWGLSNTVDIAFWDILH